MKKMRTVLLIAIALLLLTPTVILVVRATETGDFPLPEQAKSLTVTAPNGKTFSVLTDSPEYRALFTLFRQAERVFRYSCPKQTENYRLEFKDDELTETLTLMVSRRDPGSDTPFSCYIRTSENKLYCFRVPVLRIGSSVLYPLKLVWLADGVQLIDYPDPFCETATGSIGDLGLYQNTLISYDRLNSIVYPATPTAVEYLLCYDGDTRQETVTDPSAITGKNPEKVFLTVTYSVEDGAELQLVYYFLTSGNRE